MFTQNPFMLCGEKLPSIEAIYGSINRCWNGETLLMVLETSYFHLTVKESTASSRLEHSGQFLSTKT